MEFLNVSVATARITGLKKKPYYFEHKCYYAMDIMFQDASTIWVHNIPNINLGDNEEHALGAYERITKTFEYAGIHEGDTVALLFTEVGYVFAIGRTGSDTWIDAKDHFSLKKFSDLNCIITGLSVY